MVGTARWFVLARVAAAVLLGVLLGCCLVVSSLLASFLHLPVSPYPLNPRQRLPPRLHPAGIFPPVRDPALARLPCYLLQTFALLCCAPPPNRRRIHTVSCTARLSAT